jgi:F-type H+-transporting ATPase subunit gamma
MAKARAIVKRLKAVKNVRKITRTMELIATARFKKAMDRATEAAAYTRKISEIVADLSKANLKFSHPLLETHPTEKNAILLVLTSNRGLCGGYNGGVLRLTMRKLAELRGTAATDAAGEAKSEPKSVQLEVSGKRGIAFLKFQKVAMERTYLQFEDKPAFDEVNELADRYIAAYIDGKLDRLDIAYMKFESASRQHAVVETLLPVGDLSSTVKGTPVKGAAAAETAPAQAVDYEFLPSAEEILQDIVPAAFKARLFKCFLDAAVSEQIFRMVAMKGATENASDMIKDLSKQYNRARQSQITSELSEIIGGAAALE